jgi:hypothetical protein
LLKLFGDVHHAAPSQFRGNSTASATSKQAFEQQRFSTKEAVPVNGFLASGLRMLRIFSSARQFACDTSIEVLDALADCGNSLAEHRQAAVPSR